MKRLFALAICLLIAVAGFYKITEWNQDTLAGEEPIQERLEHRKEELYSKNAVLFDQNSGEILLDQQAKQRIHPASMTKIMTAYLVIQNSNDLDESVVVPADIFPGLEEENASMAGFLPGEHTNVRDLLYGVLLPSGAEACQTLAIKVSGSEEAFVNLMNEEAKRLGMSDTHFTNSTGLDDEDHYSSVYDIGLLLREALKDEIFSEIFQTETYLTSVSNLHPDGFVMNSTMRQTMEQHDLTDDHLLGGKTGYTPEAGLCLASLAEVQGKRYLFVSAGANGDSETEPFHIVDAIKVYDMLS